MMSCGWRYAGELEDELRLVICVDVEWRIGLDGSNWRKAAQK
jgi:hypothetical protein